MYRRLALALCVLGGLAWAQAKPTIAEQLRGSSGSQTIAQQLRQGGTAGPGYMQQDFLNGLGGSLQEQFGDRRGQQMLQTLQGQGLSSDDMLKLMNGQATTSQLGTMFGAGRGELDGVRSALDAAVGRKNQKMFFGILIVIVVIDCEKTDGEFLKQMCNGMEAMDPAVFEKLMRGDVSTSTIQQGFGFADKSMCKEMQDCLNAMRESPLVNHPMAQSMGMGDQSRFDKAEFPKAGEGMPGYDTHFAGGMAGGMPFDTGMPPMPFAGANMGLCCCGGGAAPGAAAPAAGG